MAARGRGLAAERGQGQVTKVTMVTQGRGRSVERHQVDRLGRGGVKIMNNSSVDIKYKFVKIAYFSKDLSNVIHIMRVI